MVRCTAPTVPSTIDSRLFRTALCRLFQGGTCNRRVCNFAHGEEELRKKPDLTKTRMCHFVIDRGSCRDANCRFAHDQSELRDSNGTWCKVVGNRWSAKVSLRQNQTENLMPSSSRCLDVPSSSSNSALRGYWQPAQALCQPINLFAYMPSEDRRLLAKDRSTPQALIFRSSFCRAACSLFLPAPV